jgi:Anti-sigma factor NepR
MSEKRPMDQRLDRQLKERIGQQLKDYYQSCLSEELPPSLLAVLKKLDEETELSDSKRQVIDDIKN